MKKSKIIGLALGLTTLTATTIATTTVLTSCSKENVCNEQLKEGFVRIGRWDDVPIPKDTKIIREKGTNNYTVYTGVGYDGKPAINVNKIVFMGILAEGFTPEQMKKLGFTETNSFLQLNFHLEEKYKEFSNLQKGNSMLLCNELWAIQLKDEQLPIPGAELMIKKC